MTGNPSDTQKGKNLVLCYAILSPSKRCNRIPIICYMERAESHYIKKNRADHTPLHIARDKGYIPPSFYHHFGRRRRSLHVRPQDTCEKNIMHAASLHHRDCNNTFSSFSNLNPDSICLVKVGIFSHVVFSPAPCIEQLLYFTLIDVMGDLWY